MLKFLYHAIIPTCTYMVEELVLDNTWTECKLTTSDNLDCTGISVAIHRGRPLLK